MTKTWGHASTDPGAPDLVGWGGARGRDAGIFDVVLGWALEKLGLTPADITSLLG